MIFGTHMNEAQGQSVPTLAVEWILNRYLKIIGLIFVFYGIYQWWMIVDTPFANAALSQQIWIGARALALPIAGVGLWMATRWGMVLGLMIAAATIIIHMFFSDAYGWKPVAVVAYAVGVLIFVTLLVSRRRGNAFVSKEQN